MQVKSSFFGTVGSSIAASMGSFLIGFESAIIAGSMLFLRKEFCLSSFQEGLVVSLLLLGAAIGSILGGFFADRLGRKKALFIAGLLFVIGSIFLIFAKNVEMLSLGRFVVGFGVGIASVVVPLYIAENSLPNERGRLVFFHQLFISLGILVAYLSSFFFEEKWAFLFLVGLVFSFVQIGLLFFIPEIQSKKLIKKKEGFFRGVSFRAFLVGLFLSVFQQISGINTVIYYTPHIFSLSGPSSTEDLLFLSLALGTINLLVTFLSFPLVDRLGRRFLLLTGFLGMFFSLVFLGMAIDHHFHLLSFFLVLSYVSFFAFSIGPCTWLVIAEIFPESVRGKAVGVSLFFNWMANYFISFSFLYLLDAIGARGTFWLYGIISLIAFFFVLRKVPETKGKSLEEIQKFFN